MNMHAHEQIHNYTNMNTHVHKHDHTCTQTWIRMYTNMTTHAHKHEYKQWTNMHINMTKHPDTNDHKRQPTTATAIQAQQQSNSPLVHRHRRPPGGAACDRCGPCGGCRPRGGSMTAPRSRDLSDTPSTALSAPPCLSAPVAPLCSAVARQVVKG